MTARLAALAGAALLAALASGCAAPFAEYQGARTAGRGNVEITGSYTSVHFSGQGESGELQREYTAQLAAGTGDHTDWRFRYTRIGPPGGDSGGGGVNVFGFGPKFAAASERVAVALPVGFAFGSNIDVVDTFQFHPTVFVTVPWSTGLELNTSGKVLVPLKSGSVGFAANVGFGISSNLALWAVRPEVGVLKYTDSDGYVMQFGLGLSYNLGH